MLCGTLSTAENCVDLRHLNTLLHGDGLAYHLHPAGVPFSLQWMKGLQVPEPHTLVSREPESRKEKADPANQPGICLIFQTSGLYTPGFIGDF